MAPQLQVFFLRNVRLAALVFFLLAVCQSATGADKLQRIFSSGEHSVALIELFTSEGCSSCPPADRWLSQLKSDPGLWKDYVPIAFHVDYWDYIGWEDRFARPEYGDRQRRHAQAGGAPAVYTPGMFRQARDWQGWRGGQRPQRDDSEAGVLRLILEGDRVRIHFDDQQSQARDLNVYLALLGMNLETSVRAGENRVRTLRHDFVALDLVSVRLRLTASGYEASTRIPRSRFATGELALAAWASEAGSLEPIQSAGGYL
jgi:hypothetical protein